MRCPTAAEIVLLARVLTRLGAEARATMALRILAEADTAERHHRLTGRAHPTFGDGSLMARCLLLAPPPEPMADDRAFLACLALAADAVRFHSAA